MINIKMQPSDVQKLSPKIAVIGVGGAGGNAVNNMISSNLEGCEFLVCNTDAQALEHSLSENRVQLGTQVTAGLGAGSRPDIGQAAAEESLEEVLKYLDGANMAFVTAGMGGGTGTGAAPVIARACREKGILTVGVVTKPFHFEGAHRMKSAEAGIEEMQEVVDTLIIIPNQNLFRIANEKTTFAEAFQMADSVLQAGVKGVTDLIVRPGLVNLDFADIRTAMLEMGKAMMGTGEASGEKRAIEAAEAAINNPLLDDVSMKGANGVIINVTGGYDMTLFEADDACNRIRDEVDPEANIIFGATFDENMEGLMRVSIVATGIEREAESGHGNSGNKGQGGVNVFAGSKGLMERTAPKLDKSAENIAQAPQAPAQSETTIPTTSFNALRSASAPTMPTAPAATQEAGEADMFEQVRLGENAQDDVQNTALRGTRYKDSFIPPKPAEVSSFHTQTSQEITRPSGVSPASMAPAPLPATAASSSLKLNPPKLPETPKRTPSLFERITGSIQQTMEGAMGKEDAAHPKTSPTLGGSSMAQNQGPAQGRLNIDSPSKPKSGGDDELDIPAFLRRQAN